MSPSAERDIRKLDPHIRKQVNQDLLCLEENPRAHGAAKLSTREDLYRIHVGPGKNYRAVYQIRDESLIVLLVRVRDRKEAYRGLR